MRFNWGDRLVAERLIDEESDLAGFMVIALARLIGEALWPLARAPRRASSSMVGLA